MPRFPKHLTGDGPVNPFPGLSALQRRIGQAIPHRLGSNEGLDMPHSVLRAHFGEAMVSHVRAYGDAEAFALRQALSAELSVPMDALLVDAGADSLIALALRGLVEAGDAVVCAGGTYPTFAYFAQGHGCRLIETAYQDEGERLAPDLDALLAAAHKDGARLVYLANPDNPSGHLHTDAAIAELRAQLPEDCWLLLDEAYHDFRDDATRSGGSEPLAGVVRLRTFSKAHGLAGLRVGYAIAEPEVLDVLQKVRIHYAVSSLSLAAAELLMAHPEEVKTHIAAVKQRRQQLTTYLRQIGGDVLPSHTNFVALRLPSADIAAQCSQALLQAGILVARPAHPALGHLLRITAVEDALVEGRLALLENSCAHQ